MQLVNDFLGYFDRLEIFEVLQVLVEERSLVVFARGLILPNEVRDFIRYLDGRG